MASTGSTRSKKVHGQRRETMWLRALLIVSMCSAFGSGPTFAGLCDEPPCCGGVCPEITRISGTYFEGTPTPNTVKEALYLDSVPADDDVSVTIDWNAGTGPFKVRFEFGSEVLEESVVAVPSTTESYSQNYDMSTFSAGDTLTIRVLQDPSTLEADSDTANFSVVGVPTGVKPDLMTHDDGNVDELIYDGTLSFLLQGGIQSGTVTPDMPVFGAQGSEIHINPVPAVTINGTSKTATLTGSGGWVYDGAWNFNAFNILLAASAGGPVPAEPIKFIIWIPVTPPIPIPAYYDGYVSVSASQSLQMTGFAGEQDPTFNGILGVNPDAEAMLGVGVKDFWLYFEGFFGGGVGLDLQYPASPTLKELLLYVRGGVRAKALLFQWEQLLATCEFRVNGVNSCDSLLPLPGSAPVTSAGSGAMDSNAFRLAERRSPVFRGGALRPTDIAAAGAAIEPAEQIIEANTFPLSSPSIAANNGELLLAWVTEDDARPTQDRSKAMFIRTIAQGQTWSEHAAIDDDGTADFDVDLASIPTGGALAVWSNAESTSDPGITLGEMASKLGIQAAHYDGTGWQSQPIAGTSTTVADRTPLVDAALDRTALVTWLAAESAGFTGSTKLRFAEFNGVSWTTAGDVLTVSGMEILAHDLAYFSLGGRQGITVFSAGDAQTLTDRELYAATYDGATWQTPVQLTTNALHDDNPQLSVDETGSVTLAWYQGGDLVSADISVSSINSGTPLSNQKTIVDRTGNSSRLADFTLIEDALTVVWQQPTAELSDLYFSSFDTTSGTWSAEQPLTTNDEEMEHSVSGVLYQGGLVLAYNDVRVTRTNESFTVDGEPVTIVGRPGVGQTDLVVLMPGNLGTLEIPTLFAWQLILLPFVFVSAGVALLLRRGAAARSSMAGL
jgi:hypothetical protein